MRFPVNSCDDAAFGLHSHHSSAVFSSFSSGRCSRPARTRLAVSYFLERQAPVSSNGLGNSGRGSSSNASSSMNQVQPGADAVSRHASLGKELLKASPSEFLELRQTGYRCSNGGLRLTSAAASSFLHSSPCPTFFTGPSADKAAAEAAAEAEEDLKTDLPHAESAAAKAENDSIFVMDKAEESLKLAEQARAVSFVALTMAFMFSFVALVGGMLDIWDYRRNRKNLEEEEQRLEQTGWPSWLRQQETAPQQPPPQDPWEALRQQLLPLA